MLVAEDDAGMRELITATLENAGYAVVVADQGTDAAQLARRPDVGLLLLDVLLPRVSGDAIAEQIRRERPKLPIILMTGDYGTLFAAAAGPPILHKPFTPEQLLDAVQRALPPTPAAS